MSMKLLLLQLLVLVVTEAQNDGDSNQQHCVTEELLDVKREFTIAFADRLTHIENYFENLNEKIANLNRENTELKHLVEKNAVDIKELPLPSYYYSHRTCHDWKLQGSGDSGEYLIDPDGKGIGWPPVSVFCDMFTGITMVHHGSEKELNISSCSGSDCLTEIVDYNMSKQQLSALVQVSEKCRQHVQIYCLESPIFKYGRAWSWWEDIHGNKQSTWSDSGCWCSETNTCLVQTDRCNCDSALAGQWLVDFGYITDSTKLPVSKLVFGTSNVGAKMRVKLGPLLCYGRKEVSYPETCKDLWLMGHSVSGYYHVGDPTNPDLVFCDMSRVLQEDYQPELSKPFNVMFYAGLTDNLKPNTTVKFDKVFMNVGGGYEASTGVFTAPVPGVYMFHVKTSGRLNGVTFIQKNGVNQVTQDGVISEDDWSSNNLPFLTALEKGDKISVFIERGEIGGVWMSSYSTVFTGFLLKRA